MLRSSLNKLTIKLNKHQIASLFCLSVLLVQEK